MLFKNIQVSHAISIISLGPTLLALVAVLLVVANMNKNARQAEFTQDIVRLAALFDGVAHTHAVERGLSAGYLSSNGEIGRLKLNDARANADAAAEKLLTISAADLNVIEDSVLQTYLSPIKTALSEKNSIRASVDIIAPNNGAFNYYSSINSLALRNIELLIKKAEDGVTSQKLISQLQLLWLKERAGQVRGALNGVFKAEQISKVQLLTIPQYLQDEQNRQSSFLAWSDEANQIAFNELQSKPAWLTVKRVVNQILQAESGPISGPDNWFEMATSRIVDVKLLSDSNASEIEAYASQVLSTTKLHRLIFICISLGFLAPLVVLGFIVKKSISSRVEQIKDFLSSVAEHKDFSKQLDCHSNDELSQIMQSLNMHISDISSNFNQIAGMTHSSKESSDRLTYSAKTAIDEAQLQHIQTAQIATATL